MISNAPELNEFQTPLDEHFFANMPEECQQQFWEFFNQVPFIKWCTAKDRPRAKDLKRDSTGKIIVDICHPHILENMEYFQPAAMHYQKYGCYTFLKPNKNKNSEYGRWIREETRRCWEGYVRPEDGEWVPGYLYFYMNYVRIEISKDSGNGKKATRIESFPLWWEGAYWLFHYLEQARNGGIYNKWTGGQHGAVLAKRGAGKSYSMASILSHDFILGENKETKEGRVMSVNAAYSKEFLAGKDGCLDKFKIIIDWCAENMQWPHIRMKDSSNEMVWKMGYKDKNTGIAKGTQNTVVGVSVKDDIGKVRGKRACHYMIEEFGTFPKLSDLFQNITPSVEDGDLVFGQIVMVGTAGDKESDFAGAANIMYNPLGHHMMAIPNVYDKEGSGKPHFVYFFPGYINRTGCCDKNGVSDVTKALKNILLDRYNTKYNSDDPFAIIKKMAEIPIVPAEAIVKLTYNMFPSVDCTERISQLDNNPREYDDVLVGDLIDNKGVIEFKPSTAQPIHIYPTKNNKVEGAIEIFAAPEIDKKTGRPFPNRYIAGVDPYDNDQAESSSLGSIFVMDLWTDNIVAEYTGRPSFANDFYEICRRLAMYYDARINYENNKKGLFTYLSSQNSAYLLTDTLESLKDKQMFKGTTFGNCSKGTVATPGVNDWARQLLRDWLLQSVEVVRHNDDGTETTISVRKLFTVRNRALLQELASYNAEGNFDRVSSMGMLMLLREDKMIYYQGNAKNGGNKQHDPRYDDKFFSQFQDEMGGIEREDINYAIS